MVSFKTRPLYPRERASVIHCIGGWVGSRAGLDAVVERKIPSPRQNWKFNKYRNSSIYER
jgi:hypothetical protein